MSPHVLLIHLIFSSKPVNLLAGSPFGAQVAGAVVAAQFDLFGAINFRGDWTFGGMGRPM